jgi:hypothetical protein
MVFMPETLGLVKTQGITVGARQSVVGDTEEGFSLLYYLLRLASCNIASCNSFEIMELS